MDSKSARVASVGLLTLWLTGGCTPKPQPVTPQSPAAPTTAEATAIPTAEPTPAPPPSSAIREDTMVLIDPGSTDEASETTLAGAARAERERRASAARPVAVITNQTLSSAGTKGGLTSATPGATAAASEGVQPQPRPTSESTHDESYWRTRALDLRLKWRQAVDDIERLERSAEHFRRRFYAEDDPYVRDSQVKPAWDRVLDQLRRAREDEEASKGELEAFLEEGHRAGALPGWLREGVEHEPEPLPEEPTPGEPVEPRVWDEEQP